MPAPFWFQKIAREGRAAGLPPNRMGQESINWFRERASRVRGVDTNKLITSTPNRLFTRLDEADVGSMLCYWYDPKWKDVLPYYDRFPLIFVVDEQNDRFHGINLHYLPLILRAQLMNALYTVTIEENNRVKRLNISYGILKNSARFSYFKPCFKEYLKTNLRSKFFQIYPEEWDMVAFLPLARFQKATQDEVWAASRRKLRNA